VAIFNIQIINSVTQRWTVHVGQVRICCDYLSNSIELVWMLLLYNNGDQLLFIC